MTKKALHPSGTLIKFFEDKHEYISEGIKYTSVTTFLNRFFPKFNAELVAKRCVGKGDYQDCENSEDVLRRWANTRDEAAAFGTKVHLYAENKLKGLPLPTADTEKESQAFEQISFYMDSLSHLEQVEPEKIVFSPELKLAGTIDLFAYDPLEDCYLLIDWKTNKKIDFKAYGKKKAYEPLESIEDCNYSKYMLQLNIYSTILRREGYVDKDIKMRLVHINKEIGLPQVYEIEPREDLMEKLVLERRATIAARLEDYMALARKNVGKWMDDNPGKHPVEMYKDMATAIVNWVKEDGIEEISVNPAAFNGGVPEYTYAICFLNEARIHVIKENKEK